MRIAKIYPVLLAASLVSFAVAQGQQPKPIHIHGVVVDEGGTPIEGALIGPYLRRMDKGGSAPVWQPIEGVPSAVSGSRGTFEEVLNAGTKIVCGVDSKTATAGYAKVNALSRSSVRIVLQRLVPVEAHGTLKGLGCNTSLSLFPRLSDGDYLFSLSTRPGQTLLLPPGKYMVRASSPEGISAQVESVTIGSTRAPVTMAPVSIRPNMMRSLYGKTPPPFAASEARGIPTGVQPADFKGKWLIVDFWGYKCHPCVTESIPGLIKFYNEHPEQRNRFQIITVHINYPKGYGLDAGRHFDTLEPELKTLENSYWGGKELPFPILLDESGAITKNWGIQEIPHQVLIDPDGNVVKDAVGLLGGGDCLAELAKGISSESEDNVRRK